MLPIGVTVTVTLPPVPGVKFNDVGFTPTENGVARVMVGPVTAAAA